jgi:hypothetical protein
MGLFVGLCIALGSSHQGRHFYGVNSSRKHELRVRHLMLA